MSDKTREQHDKFYQECGLHANIIINAGITQREVELLLAAQSAASWQAAHEMYAPKWLPIESAPKDGSHVIVCKIGLTHDVQGETLGSERWKEVVFNSDPTIESVWWASSARFKDGKWRWSNETLVEPTHWMPLPKKEQDE